MTAFGQFLPFDASDRTALMAEVDLQPTDAPKLVAHFIIKTCPPLVRDADLHHG
jgi:hypothetical protein